MTRYAIDAPTLLAVVADEVPVHPSHQLVAPGSVRSQALALLFAAVRRGDLDEKEARRRHTRLTELRMRLLGDRVSRWTAWQIAMDAGWDTTTDAEYLAVTRLQADALVTVDERMTALARGRVPLAPLGALSVP